ncbi:hypothetical protein B0H16DRAFT_1766472 [Mycena metata]|uniref:DUF6589 domain-containing protein n=1 Tax=Mycena metata TaxID=1033252 RepID=A0AAD7IVX8_9AGAR|nr:hypothetical protein B0H16DRAFT_1839987 [Mycena metata]KAJ7773368.1 hypothetical protein B0H16DRAFT_1766472 [Mycena metata]
MASGTSQPRKNPGTRTYKRIPTTLDANPDIPQPRPDANAYRLDPTAPNPPPTTYTAPDFSHTQPRMRSEKQSIEEKTADKFAAVDELLKTWKFDTIGDFLSILFYNKPRGDPDPRGTTHAHAVAQFLRGRSKIKMCDILPLVYHHKASYPTKKSADSHEKKSMFSTAGPENEINHARPFMSTWAARLVASEARKQVGRATRDDPDRPEEHSRFRASSNGRTNAHVVTWPELLANFSITKIHAKYCLRLPLPMFLTESMAAPSTKGVIFVRKRRPHPMIQVGAIASFLISRNRYANGDLAMALGVWHVACKSHVDVKRVYCRLGSAVSDTTSHNALNAMSEADLVALRAEIAEATERGEREGCLLVDNVQKYCDVYEEGVGRQSQMKVGTAGTWVRLDGCSPGAFHAKPYYDQVAKQERANLETGSLYDSIDWKHIKTIIPLQWVRALVEFEPKLHHLLPEVNIMFRVTLAIRPRPPNKITSCQPLGTNSEHSTETQGMRQAIKDFDNQTGIDSDNPGNLLSWIRGDGASFAAVLNLINYSTPVGTFKNKIGTPEIWHTGATDLNSTSANHHGPASSSDPSSLSKCFNIAGFKRPSNVKSCDYYPTVRNLSLIWTAKVLDCWRLHFDVEDLHEYFQDLAQNDKLPTLIDLIQDAIPLYDRYATQGAIRASLSAAEATHPDRFNKVPVGSPWTAPSNASDRTSPDLDDLDLPGLADIIEPDTPTNPSPPKKSDNAPTAHTETEGFTGDRVLRNSQIFLQDFGWWIEFGHAVPEGDIGRVWEIMKIWIFKFAGSSHQNYVNYLLEVYCMLRYEASKGLSDAILDNWLLKIKDELGHCLPADLHQEHYNKWLEDMIQKHGGEFDNKYYRQTIAPNVHHFLQMKKEVETAFEFKPRGQTHTSPHSRPELQLLLTAFKEEEVHLFRSGRSLGHAAVNQFARGWKRLDAGKLTAFLEKSTALGDFLKEIRRSENPDVDMDSDSSSESGDRSSDIHGDGSSDVETADNSSSIRGVDSPTPSIPSSDITVDANEPEDDGEDLSDAHLSAGSENSEAEDEDGKIEGNGEVDPNEPDDDGIDLSTTHLSTADRENGLEAMEAKNAAAEGEGTDEEEEEESDEEREEPESESDDEEV